MQLPYDYETFFFLFLHFLASWPAALYISAFLFSPDPKLLGRENFICFLNLVKNKIGVHKRGNIYQEEFVVSFKGKKYNLHKRFVLTMSIYF